MKPKIAQIVTEPDWELFGRIRKIMSALPDTFICTGYLFGRMPLPRSMFTATLHPSCHMITRALSYFLPVVVHDGYIIEKRLDDERLHPHEHSWLTRRDGDERIIFDPQPLGVVSGPALYIQDYAFHFRATREPYQPMRSPEFRAEVAAVRLAIRHLSKSGT